MKRQDRVDDLRHSLHLADLAEHLESSARWENLALPAAECQRLLEIVRHIKHSAAVTESFGHSPGTPRGSGVIAQFAGPHGPSKILAAAVLANDLNLPLYRIDLSRVVSKYIGETEKNLRKLFDAAEKNMSLLFFDEADALFGKRSEVKDNHDRYSNMEVAYLLQRLESHEGVVILATNLKSAFPAGFSRRIHTIIWFASPRVSGNMAQSSVNKNRIDPYKNFKFRIKWEGKYVAGFSKIGPLKQSDEPVNNFEGGRSRVSPNAWKFKAITLERGATHDPEFNAWANLVYNNKGKAAISLKNFRKDLIIELLNEQGMVAKAYKIYRCWVSEYLAMPELDTNSNTVAIESMTLQARDR